ncbi:MFS transporter [Paenibacillus albiflavus]|uniref:MFS transporter n=1 Tax=Paenibacillus albiflavus TaxID=2545760 RepID=A0A4R4EEL7_9BACL|nr:MFS transporter [Paenibacillus albiflavus]TCZ77693.1 MFS transporter [Paenibacillus albiflavus]
MTSPTVTGRPNFITLKIFNFVIYGAMAIFNTFFPLYLKHIGVSTIAVGFLLAGGPMISVLANPIWGYYSDRMQNIKRTLVMMLIANLIIAQIVFQLHSYLWIYVVMVGFYFFQTPIFSQSNSLILNVIEGTTVKFGAIRLWASIGYSVTALLIGPLLQAVGIDSLGLVFSTSILLTLAFTISLPRGESRGDFSNADYKQIFHNKHFVWFVLLGILISVPNSMNATFNGIFIMSMGGSENLVGWSIFIASVLEVPVFLLLDRFLKRTKGAMVIVLIFNCLLYSLRWLLMSLAQSPVDVILIQGLHGLTYGTYFYVGTQLTSMMVPREYRASGQAAFALTWGGLSGFFAGIFGGIIFEKLGASQMYMTGVLLTLLGAVGFYLLWISLRRDSAKEIKASTTH